MFANFVISTMSHLSFSSCHVFLSSLPSCVYSISSMMSAMTDEIGDSMRGLDISGRSEFMRKQSR